MIVIENPNSGGGAGPQGPQGPEGPEGPPGAGLENTDPYVVPTYDANGNLIYTQVLKDGTGQDIFDFSKKGDALTSDSVDFTYIDWKISVTSGDANERSTWEQVKSNMENVQTRVEELEDLLKAYKLLP